MNKSHINLNKLTNESLVLHCKCKVEQTFSNTQTFIGLTATDSIFIEFRKLRTREGVKPSTDTHTSENEDIVQAYLGEQLVYPNKRVTCSTVSR